MKSIMLILFLVCYSSLAKDPFSSMQWGVHNTGQPIYRANGELTRELVKGTPGIDIDVPDNYIYSDKKVIVAVIDSGVDIYHPDLKENIWLNPKCEQMDDEQRANEDCNGWNFLDGNADVSDDIGHGTHVAGIIAATENNGIGIKGVASRNVKIMPLKILNSKVKSFVYEKRVITDIIADAIAYAVTNGATVINLSLGWPALIHTKKVRYAIDTAIKRNVAVVVASGNNNKKLPVFPCAYNEVICVGAMDNKGEISEFSNFGGKVDLIAPGEGIVSTYPRSLESRVLRIPGYEIKQGSSQAAPFVSALIALLQSGSDNLSLDEIKYKLFKSSKYSGKNKSVKYGRVSFNNSLSQKVSEGAPSFKVKSLTEVTVGEDGRFEFFLPIRALVKSIDNLDFVIKIKDGDRTILNEKYNVKNILTNKETNVRISSSISDFRISSHLDLFIEYNNSSIRHEIALVRKALDISGVISKKLPFKDSDVLMIRNGRSSSALRKVISNKYDSKTLDYFILGKSKSINTTLIHFTKIDIASINSLDIEIPEIGKLINIVKNDFNNDGVTDYMIYSLSKNDKELVLTFVGSDGKLLYENYSQWFLEISTFEGLPFFNGEVKFEYLNVNFLKYGNIKVPVFMKKWTMPDSDNTRDPLDHVDDGVMASRPYFLKPSLKGNKVSLDIRTLASVSFLNNIREKFQINERVPMVFDQLLEQDSSSNSLKGIIVAGREFAKRYFYIEYFSDIKFSSREVYFNGVSLDSNTTLVSRYDNEIFNASFALNFRNELRTVFWNLEGERSTHQFSTESWGDLIIDIFDFSKNRNSELILLESRYFIHAFNVEGDKYKLPINRESSFPGVNFSETFKKINISTQNDPYRGILVDSTLIYGNRLYSMIYNGDSFSPPVYSSLEIPRNCKNLDVNKFDEGTYVVLACEDKFLRATLELIPLKERVK